MTFQKRLSAFIKLGNQLRQVSEEDLSNLAISAKSQNGWFVESEIKRALSGIISMLAPDQLKSWTQKYDLNNDTPFKVGVVMAGNIPFVGFHDLLAVLISGHELHAKLSSQDALLMKFIINKLLEIEPDFKISFPERLTDIDAVIATGSDNSARYFDYYFQKIPNLIRKNRTSIAVLTGNETEEDFKKLGLDIFSYFGLGCRNVSKIYTPQGFDLTKMLDAFEIYNERGNHHKYRNNYDYNKSIFLVNNVSHLDNGFLLLQENNALVSPISVLFKESYDTLSNCYTKLTAIEDKIQCIVNGDNKLNPSENNVSFGESQFPKVWDYADQVDTLVFLSRLKE